MKAQEDFIKALPPHLQVIVRQELDALKERQAKRGKYNNVRTKGITSDKVYASGLEMGRAELLRMSERSGHISELEEQPLVQMTKFHTYRPDFVYLENGRLVFDDAKGKETERFEVNVRLWRERGPGILRVSKKAKYGGGWAIRDYYPETYDESMWKRKKKA